MPDDLWPDDLAPLADRAPVAILREQAAALTAKTQGRIEGVVQSLPSVPGQPPRHSFFIHAPSLNYRFRLLTVMSGTFLYPSRVESAVGTPFVDAGATLVVENERELVDHLREIFTSGECRKIIGALLAQVEDPSSLV